MALNAQNSGVVDGYSDYDEISDDNDDKAPCPSCPISCLFPCCWRSSIRQSCAIKLLTSTSYLVIYFLIIVITLVLLVYDLAHGDFIHDLKDEPLWFIGLDIGCISLMAFDVFIQMCAYPEYCKSAMNIFDFIVVLLCIFSVPIYFFVPDSDFVLTVVILLRFIAQLLRIVMIYKHHENRQQYVRAIKQDVVDFTHLDDNSDTESQKRLLNDTNINDNIIINDEFNIQNNTHQSTGYILNNQNTKTYSQISDNEYKNSFQNLSFNNNT